MPPIRIVVAELPADQRTAVATALADEPDIVVVADAVDEVAALLEAGLADVAIVGMAGGELPPIAERLLDEYPRIGVLAVDLEREQGLLYRLRPEMIPIDKITPSILAAAIRSAARGIAV